MKTITKRYEDLQKGDRILMHDGSTHEIESVQFREMQRHVMVNVVLWPLGCIIGDARSMIEVREK